MTPLRVLYLSEIPTPYRTPLLERLARRPELDLEVLYCADSEPDRPWAAARGEVPRSSVLRGRHLVLRSRRGTFVYEFNPGIVPRLLRRDYDVLVIAGYSVFAEQVAILWARASRTPYLLHSESHLGKVRAGWKLRVKGALLPQVVGAATGGLAVGSAAARYLEAYGLPRERIRIVPNTIDVAAWAARAEDARRRDRELRSELGLPGRYLLYVGRLVEAKGVPELVKAHRLLGPSAPPLVVVGDGPLAPELRGLPNVRLAGFVQPEQLAPYFALAWATAVPSRDEPWGVVVNEALACGSSVLATEAVGAAEDLIEPGRDGLVVPPGDAGALLAALRRLEAGPLGPPSGRILRWTYELGVQQFVEALALAA